MTPDYQPPSTVPISVAIPAFGNEKKLAHTLERILSCRPLPQEILLHFDGGWNPPTDFSANAPIPVHLFRSREHIGPGGGRGLLFHHATCELIATFDDDSWPLDADYFAQAFAVMEAFPDAAILSPAVYLREKPILPPLMEVTTSRSYEGSASIHRRSVHLKLPGYVPIAHAYGVEEADISLQTHAAGYQLLSCPWMRAWHNRPYTDNVHSIKPWIKNEVLLAYLRYPLIAQPWGWIRSLRHVLRHRHQHHLASLLRALLESVPLCAHFSKYKHRYGLCEVWKHHLLPKKRWSIKVAPGESTSSLKINVSAAPESHRVLYLQYTNPGGYPPLQHSSQILARRGWQVEFCGLSGQGGASLDFPPHPRIRVRSMAWCAPGLKQKLHYLKFMLWSAWRAWRFRPHWLYCSDSFSSLPGLLIAWLLKCQILYHEHDSPVSNIGKDSAFSKFSDWGRIKIGHDANLVVAPNELRLAVFVTETQRAGLSFCVWNCPALNEVSKTQKILSPQPPLRVLYHGSIVPDRFPPTILKALAHCGPGVTLRLVGYETLGRPGYTHELQAEAKRLDITDQFEYLGSLPQRSDLLARCAECDVGLAMLRIHDQDINMQHMTGASNKPFDYLSQGLALVVSPDPEWDSIYVQNGCALSCDLDDVPQMTNLLSWMRDHREEVRAMGEKGKQLVIEKWNYESQFQAVLEQMEDL